jgi:PRTRC genetic system protein A
MGNVGYLYYTEKGLVGTPGTYYDYIVARNGLFIRAENQFLKAIVCIGEANVRGLYHLPPMIELKYGKVPWHLYHLAISIMMADALREHYLAITWDNGYHLQTPTQTGTGGSCQYERVPNTVVELHSHCMMRSFFSPTDNQDEQGMGIYAVVGKLNMMIPEIEMRIGVYGYFGPLSLKEVFDHV